MHEDREEVMRPNRPSHGVDTAKHLRWCCCCAALGVLVACTGAGEGERQAARPPPATPDGDRRGRVEHRADHVGG